MNVQPAKRRPHQTTVAQAAVRAEAPKRLVPPSLYVALLPGVCPISTTQFEQVGVRVGVIFCQA